MKSDKLCRRLTIWVILLNSLFCMSKQRLKTLFTQKWREPLKKEQLYVGLKFRVFSQPCKTLAKISKISIVLI